MLFDLSTGISVRSHWKKLKKCVQNMQKGSENWCEGSKQLQWGHRVPDREPAWQLESGAAAGGVRHLMPWHIQISSNQIRTFLQPSLGSMQ